MEEKNLQILIKELIGGDFSYADEYKAKQKDFPYSNINRVDQAILNFEYQDITNLLLKFQENNRGLFKIAINKDTLDDVKKESEIYIEICSFYINSIQNIYLNPISYRLNQLNSEKSLKKAEQSIALGIKSIGWAKISIWIAIITGILSLLLSIASIKLTYHYGNNPTPCSCCFSEKTETNYKQNHVEKDHCFVNKLDTVMTK